MQRERRRRETIQSLVARGLRLFAGPLGLAALGALTLVCVGALACNEVEIIGSGPSYLSPAEQALAERTLWPATIEGHIEMDVTEPAPGDDLFAFGVVRTTSGEVLVFAMDSQLQRWDIDAGTRVRARVRPSDPAVTGASHYYDLVSVEKL